MTINELQSKPTIIGSVINGVSSAIGGKIGRIPKEQAKRIRSKFPPAIDGDEALKCLKVADHRATASGTVSRLAE